MNNDTTKPLAQINTTNWDLYPEMPTLQVVLTHIDGYFWVETMCGDTYNEYSRHPEIKSLKTL